MATFKTQCLSGARAGGIWYCEGKQLWKFTEGSAPVKVGELPAGGLRLTPTVVHEDRAGRLWIGTGQEGLFCYDGTAFERVPTSHQDILGLTEDREGNLWVGTRGGGINQVKPRAVELLTPDAATPFAGVCSVCQDTSGRLWAVAKNSSVSWSDDGGWIPMSSKDWGKDIYVQCVAPDAQGGVWIGTKANAAQLWRDGAFIASLGTTDGYGGDAVGTLALLTSPAGEVWSGTRTFDGKHLALLHRRAGGETRAFELPVAGGPVVVLAVDAAGDCWAATAKGSLWRVRQDDLTDETGRTLAGAPPIRCLCAAPDGSLWLGYGGQGLGRLTDSGFSHYWTEQGLPDDYLSNILADGRGRLWFAGNRGIFSVRAGEFDALAAGRVSRVGAVLYGQNDGLLRLQASHDSWPGALRDDEGKLWFAMESGLAVVNAPGLPPQPDPPPVLLEGVTVNGRTVAAYGVGEGAASAAPHELWRGAALLRLPAGSKQLEIAYTALGFTKPESIGFRYRLAPLDKDWVDAGVRRVASYPQLPPGDYYFEVLACNGDGAWSTTGATLGLKVLPQFWQTWWFRIAAALVLLGSGAGAVRHVATRRMRRQVERAERARALERERSRIAKDIHDDLGASLTEITLLSELAQSGEAPAAEVRSDMRKIAARTRQLTRTLDTTVWAVNPRNDTLYSLVSYTCHHAEDFLKAADIRCRIDVPSQVPEQVLTATVRHEVFLIVKEALHNVVKHSRASEVTLRVTTRAAGVTFVVEDNGRGFTPATVRLGGAGRERNGLSNMYQRAAEIGGSLELHSTPGQGTRIQLDIHFDLT
ncbi:MAG: triple tyrosine motif-containing protein [Verrucomicrobia bacterium]|nr:triple tyrosine motif-containing protein [Verrucomicrobiota bacterium]